MDTGISAKRLKVGIGQAALVLVLAIISRLVLAAGAVETAIKPFALVDVQATFSARYMLDENDRFSDITPKTYEDRVTWEEELFVLTKSYVYHPGFLNIDFGIGPKLVQQRFESDLGSNRNREQFLNLLARLNFLQLKSYTFSLYFQTDSPSVSTGLAGRYLTEREQYGVNAQLYQSGRTRVWLDVAHVDNFGGGFGNVLDEEVDTGDLNLETTYGERNTLTFRHRQENRKSESGSVGLPIQASAIRHRITELRASNNFGSEGRHSLVQNYRRFRQELVQPTALTTYSNDYNIRLNLAHSERLSTLATYNFAGVEREDDDFLAHRLRASLIDTVNQNLSYTIDTFYDTEDQPGFERDTLGGGTTFAFNKPIRNGSLGAGFRARVARTDQASTSDRAQVFDEPLVLVSTNPVALAQDFVVLESVVVKNESQTQVFVEGFDYRLIVVGSVTSVQRLVGSNIQDGERVLVDYEYQTSGTAEFDTLTTNVNLSASFLSYFSAGADFQLRDTKLRSGELTTLTNDLEGVRLTFAADFPIGDRWQFGLSASHWDKDEEISPSVSNTLTIQALAYLGRATRLRLSGTRLTVDQEQSVEDIDQVQYRVGLSSRLWSRLLLSYDVTYLEDDGGSLPRQQTQHRLDIQWNYRAVRFFLRATRADERLGTTRRDYTRVTAEVARFFR